MKIWVQDIGDNGKKEEHGGDNQGTGVEDKGKLLKIDDLGKLLNIEDKGTLLIIEDKGKLLNICRI